MKLKELMNDMFKQSIFDADVDHVWTIEFQKRGLQQAHILLTIAEADKLWNVDDYDQWISVELPDPQLHPQLYDIVLHNMVHGPCGSLYPTSSYMVNKKCSKNYPKSFVLETHTNEDGYPLYKQRDNGAFVMKNKICLDNRWIVLYSLYCTPNIMLA